MIIYVSTTIKLIVDVIISHKFISFRVPTIFSSKPVDFQAANVWNLISSYRISFHSSPTVLLCSNRLIGYPVTRLEYDYTNWLKSIRKEK